MKSSHFQNNTQTFNDFAKDNELPIDNFEQWARLVKDQMLKSLHSRLESYWMIILIGESLNIRGA